MGTRDSTGNGRLYPSYAVGLLRHGRRVLGQFDINHRAHRVHRARKAVFQWPDRPSLYNPVVHFVYMVRCADGTLYTGYARDPHAREKAHNSGRGARYTSGRRPVRLVYSETFESLSDALKREYQLKRLTRVGKEALIAARTRRRAERLAPVKRNNIELRDRGDR
jgi:putative endonuclease